MFGSVKDIEFFNRMNREFMEKISGQHINYYVINVDSETNIYGESLNKMFYDPIFLYAFVDHKPQEFYGRNNLPDYNRQIDVYFWRKFLEESQIYPKMGDVIEYNEYFYQITSVIENKYFGGKTPELSKITQLEKFGGSLSVIVSATYVSEEKLGIVK